LNRIDCFTAIFINQKLLELKNKFDEMIEEERKKFNEMIIEEERKIMEIIT
jgi:hypothetical protein